MKALAPALVLLVASTATAQEPATEGTSPPAEPPAEAAAPDAGVEPPRTRAPVIEPVPVTAPPEAEEGLRLVAGQIFAALLRGEPDVLSWLFRTPFQLDSERVERHELAARLQRLLAGKPLSRARLNGVTLLPAAEMVERHGPPPARLASVELTGAWVAVGDLGGKAVVVVLRKDGGSWRAVALTE